MSSPTVPAESVITFSQAADALGMSHVALAHALERGEIVRMAGSTRNLPMFRPAEIERYRRLLQRRQLSSATDSPVRAGDVDTSALLLKVVRCTGETEAGGELAGALQALAGAACSRALILRLDDDLETVRILGDSLRTLTADPIELSSGGYRTYRERSGLGRTLDHGVPSSTEQPAVILAFLELREIAALLNGATRRAFAVRLAAGQGSGVVAVLLLNAPLVEERQRALEAFAVSAGLALESVRRNHELTQRAARAEALQGAARLLARVPEYQDLLTRIAEIAADLLRADAAAMLTKSDSTGAGGEMRLGGATGLADAALSWSATLSAKYRHAHATGVPAPLQVADATASPGLSLPRLEGNRPALAALCAPVVNRGVLLGALEVYCTQPRAFSDEEVELLASFAEQTAMVVASLRGQEGRQRALLGAVEALASSIEARDGYTGEHCKRAVSRATLVARFLGLSEREVETIGLAAALHDIGKIAVPDAILRKPGALTPEELAVIRRHPEVGEQIVAWVPELREVSRLVGAHQERWDGSGYPLGLTGEQIPLGARIIAVIDAYAAMTEDRPYRRGGTRQDAIDELVHGSGTQFDPSIVEAFQHVLATTPPGATELLDADRHNLKLDMPAAGAAAGSGRGSTGYLPVRRWHSRRASELAALNDILRAISSTLDLRRIYDLIYLKVSDLIDIDAFLILQASADVTLRERVHISAGDVTFVESPHFPIIGTPAIGEIIAEVARSGRSVCALDYPSFLAEHDLPPQPGNGEQIGAIIATPITLGDELLGLISVQSRRVNSYDERHVGLLEEIALHIGLALRNAGVYAEARRRAEQFEAIGRLAANLNQLRDPTQIAQAFAAESKHVVHSEECLVFFVRENRHVLAAIEGDYSVAERAAYCDFALPRGQGILWWAIEHGETVIVPDLTRDERDIPQVRPPDPGDSGLVVPLIHEGQTFAVTFMVRAGVPFSADDAQAMQVLASHAATAISDALTHLESQRRVRELEALQRAVAIVSANLQRETAVKAIVDVLADLFGYGHVSMYSREGDNLVMLAQVGYTTPLATIPINRGVLARCVRSGQSILVRDVSLDPEYLGAAEGVRSEVAVPVFHDGRVVGGLNVESDSDRQLGDWDLALIELFSQQVGVALANVSQYEQAVQRASIDPVSRLPNHGALMERLHSAVHAAQSTSTPLALLFIDLDNFKRFNDAFGHRVGDQVLFAVGRYLEHRLPAGAYIARYGGEEFVALLPETSVEDALRFAESARAHLAHTPLETGPQERFQVTISIGVAGISPHQTLNTPEELLDLADRAMYTAKRLGRNRVVRWQP